MNKSIAIFVAILLGVLLPYGADYVHLIRYNLMIMLLFAFLSIEVNRSMFHMDHLKILGFHVLLPFLFYFSLLPLNKDIALIGFIMGIAPTAAGAPIFAFYLKTNVAFVTTSVLLVSPVVAILLPFLFPLILPDSGSIQVQSLLIPIASIVGIPLLLSQLIKKASPALTKGILRMGQVAFFLFLLNLWLASSKATQYLWHDQNGNWNLIWKIVLATSLVGVVNFWLGSWIGKGNEPLARSLALGRKNTMFSLWLALTYINPLVALGPIAYILFQNVYNAVQLARVK